MSGKTFFEGFALHLKDDEDPGNPPSTGAIAFSRPQGGCSDPACTDSAHKTGHYITVLLPMDANKIIHGGTLCFANREDLIQFSEIVRQAADAYLKSPMLI